MKAGSETSKHMMVVGFGEGRQYNLPLSLDQEEFITGNGCMNIKIKI
jgi:hypothetical protein